MHFTLDNIQQLTSSAAFARGQAYFRQHKVLFTHLDHVHEQMLDWLADAIPRMLELLVFSQFTEVLGLIEADLKQHIAYSKLTGLM